MKVVASRDHAELLEHQLLPLQSFRVLVVREVLRNVTLHLLASNEFALHLVPYWQAGVMADQVQKFLHRAKELFRLRLGDGRLRLGRGGWLNRRWFVLNAGANSRSWLGLVRRL